MMMILVECVKILRVHILYRLIHCTWVYPLEEFDPFFGYYFFNVMLLVLQILHLYWAVLISRMLYKFIFSKVCFYVYVHSREAKKCMKTVQNSASYVSAPLQLEGDDRSDEEEADSDSPKERNHKLSHINGSGARGRANGH